MMEDEAASAPTVDRSSRCPQCGCSFANYAGRRLHQRKAHSEEFHEAEVQRLAARPKDRWDREEVAVMAAFERDHLGEPGLNETIHAEVLPHRTVEAIKGKRRQASYRQVLEEGPSFSSDVGPSNPPHVARLAGRRARAPRPARPQTLPPVVEEDEDPSATVGPPPVQDNLMDAVAATL